MDNNRDAPRKSLVNPAVASHVEILPAFNTTIELPHEFRALLSYDRHGFANTACRFLQTWANKQQITKQLASQTDVNVISVFQSNKP